MHNHLIYYIIEFNGKQTKIKDYNKAVKKYNELKFLKEVNIWDRKLKQILVIGKTKFIQTIKEH